MAAVSTGTLSSGVARRQQEGRPGRSSPLSSRILLQNSGCLKPPLILLLNTLSLFGAEKISELNGREQAGAKTDDRGVEDVVTGETLSRGSTLDRSQGSAQVPTAEVTVSRGFKRRFEAPWEENELLRGGVKTQFSVRRDDTYKALSFRPRPPLSRSSGGDGGGSSTTAADGISRCITLRVGGASLSCCSQV